MKKDEDNNVNSYEGLKGEPLDFILEQANKKLEDTIKFGLSFDQKASSAAAMFSATSVAITVLLLESKISASDIKIGMSVFALLLFIASVVCVYAARSTAFDVSGYDPEILSKYLIQNNPYKPIQTLKQWLLCDVERRINSNSLKLCCAGKLYNFGLLISVIGAVAAVIICIL